MLDVPIWKFPIVAPKAFKSTTVIFAASIVSSLITAPSRILPSPAFVLALSAVIKATFFSPVFGSTSSVVKIRHSVLRVPVLMTSADNSEILAVVIDESAISTVPIAPCLILPSSIQATSAFNKSVVT